ncbi:MAG: hypothetical protein V1694_01000 [Candidatus Eisenbacteria bacterium]
MKCALLIMLVLVCLALPALGFEKKAYQIGEDFGTETVTECNLQYYYYIPCPTFSWFWGFYGWTYGDKVGQFYTIGDASTAGFATCDPESCHSIVGIRVLDFAGYGQIYPGLYTVKFNIYCSNELGCPVGASLWESQPIETSQDDWTFIEVDPPVPVTGCCVQVSPPLMPRILVTATSIGTDNTYPQWGMDNVSAAAIQVCAMHDIGSVPALYPRPASSHYSTIHSGYYGVDFQYCPPIWFKDGADTTQDASIYGYLEFAWRLYVRCFGPQGTKPTTWGSIKSIYR